jgi:hypothetical protein
MHTLAGKTIDPIIRVSSLGGRIVSADSTMTLGEQEASMRRSIEAMGGKVGKVHQAVDASGFTFAASEDMDAIVARVGNQSDGLAFAYLDRNGRNWWAQGAFFSKLQAAGGAYVIPGYEGIDYRTPVGRQVFGMAAVSNETTYFAARDRSARIQDGVMARKVPNRVSYGHRRNATFIDGKIAAMIDPERDAKALVVDGYAGPIVARMFDLAITGHSTRTIAAMLNAENIAAPNGGEWTHSSVRSILANEIYKGVIVFGRLSGKKANRVRKPESEWRRVYDPAMAIVSAATWQAAQSTRTVRRTGAYKAGVAGGLLTCSGCGRVLSVIGTGDGRLNYGCRRHSSAGTCAAPTNIKKDVCDELVDELVAGVLAGTAGIDTVAFRRARDDAGRALDAAKAERDGLLEKVSPTHPSFAEFLATLDAKVEAAQANFDAANAQAGAAANLPAADEYLALDVPARNAVASVLLAGIVVNPPTVAARRVKLADMRARLSVSWR